jgi:lipoprotein-anchoring transpeptidase ErfK/SrfK
MRKAFLQLGLSIWAIFAVEIACSARWAGPPPGYTEPSLPSAASSEQSPVGGSAGTGGEPSLTASAVPATPSGGTAQKTGEALASAAFPAGTRSLTVKDQAHVRSGPSDLSRYIGKITRGTRVGWKRVVAEARPDDDGADGKRRRRGAPCPSWVEIEPLGFLCSSLLTPSNAEPNGERLPRVPRGKLAPDDYYHINADETNVYKTPEDVRGGVVEKQLSTKVMVVGTGLLNVDGTDYLKTDHGLVENSRVARYWPSDFAGVDVRERPPAAWPFAWVYAVRGGRGPEVVNAPAADAQVVRRATRREIVPIFEERAGYVRLGDAEWIERKHVREALLSQPPDGLAAGQQWIDVDLDEQVLVAYEGKTPVFATLVSTGKKGHATPPAAYRVRAKAATTSMAGDPEVPNRYEVSAVPWAVRFRSGLFIHGVYWHDGFGGVLSHGCVNVSPKDAASIYEWVAPAVPNGWSEIEVPPGEGVIVRVRDRANPTPRQFDYTEEDQR